jgi:two-component system chemotaxis response regulator CheB
MKQIKVMIVEDSRVVREFLEHIIAEDPRLTVAASVSSAEEGLNVLPRVRPDVISLDIRLPGMDGLAFTKRVMVEQPTPIVVVSSDVENDELNISMNALRAGALAVVQKPVGATHQDYRAAANSICTKLAIMSEVRVIQQRGRKEDPTGRPRTSIRRSAPHAAPKVLGLVASTGGPNALVRVLSDLGARFPIPIVLVQHITPGFLAGFVRWMNDTLGYPVVEAHHAQQLTPGTIHVAPPDRHLAFSDQQTLALINSPPVSMQRPSGTVLLRSIAEVFGAQSAGVVLTGMGDDGADGLFAMHQAGAFTIAEHQSTAVVYGMPASAVAMGATDEILPLQEIGPRLTSLFQPGL